MSKKELDRLKKELSLIQDQVPREHLILFVRALAAACFDHDLYFNVLAHLGIEIRIPNWDKIVSKALDSHKIYLRD
jgi:hypothetical protein